MTDDEVPSPNGDNSIKSFAAVLDLFGLVKKNIGSAISLADMIQARRHVATLKASMTDLAVLRGVQYKVFYLNEILRKLESGSNEVREIIETDFVRLRDATERAKETFRPVSAFLNFSNPRLVAEVENALHERTYLLEQVLDQQAPEQYLPAEQIVEVYEQYSQLTKELTELLSELSSEIAKRSV